MVQQTQLSLGHGGPKPEPCWDGSLSPATGGPGTSGMELPVPRKATGEFTAQMENGTCPWHLVPRQPISFTQESLSWLLLFSLGCANSLLAALVSLLPLSVPLQRPSSGHIPLTQIPFHYKLLSLPCKASPTTVPIHHSPVLQIIIP